MKSINEFVEQKKIKELEREIDMLNMYFFGTRLPKIAENLKLKINELNRKYYERVGKYYQGRK